MLVSRQCHSFMIVSEKGNSFMIVSGKYPCFMTLSRKCIIRFKNILLENGRAVRALVVSRNLLYSNLSIGPYLVRFESIASQNESIQESLLKFGSWCIVPRHRTSKITFTFLQETLSTAECSIPQLLYHYPSKTPLLEYVRLLGTQIHTCRWVRELLLSYS